MCLKARTLKKCAWEWVSANTVQLPSPFTQIWTIRLAFSSLLSTLPPPVSTTVAASFLTAIVTPPEAQLTLYNSLVLRATAATTFPLLFRIFTSHSVYKPQRHPFCFLYPPKKHLSVHQEDPLKCVHFSHPSSFFFLLCFLLFFHLVLLLLVVISNCLQLPMFVASVDLAPTCCYPAQEHHPCFQPDASPLTSVGATGCGTSFAPSSAEGCVSCVWLLFFFNLCNSAYIMLARFVLLM